MAVLRRRPGSCARPHFVSQQVWDSQIKYTEAASIDDYFGRILRVGVINIAQTARHKFGQYWHLKWFWRQRVSAQLEALSILGASRPLLT